MAEIRACSSATRTSLPGRIPGRLYDSMGNDVTDIAHLMGGGVYDHLGRRVVGETAQRREERVARSREVATRHEPRRRRSIGGLLVGVIRFVYRIIMAW